MESAKALACICSNNVDIITPLGLNTAPIAQVLFMSMNFYETFPKVTTHGGERL